MLFRSREILSPSEIQNILNFSLNSGVGWLDTAQSYGDTETQLGKFGKEFKIATKFEFKNKNYTQINALVEKSLMQLKVDKLELLFIHDWDKLTKSEKQNCELFCSSLITNKMVLDIGVSTYEFNDLHRLLQNGFFIQVCSNALDQRLIEVSDGLTKYLNERIWIRSIFLQGLLLTQHTKSKLLNHECTVRFFNYANLLEISPFKLALNYFLHNFSNGFKLILGVHSINELELNLATENIKFFIDWESLKCNHIDVIDPRLWI